MAGPSKDYLIQKYINEGLSMQDISNISGYAVGTIYNYLHKYKIRTRRKNEYEVTEETRKKIGKASRYRIYPKRLEETKLKMSNSKLGKFKVITKYGGHKKNRADGYVSVYVPNHPHANKDHYVMEHVLVMEEAIGRYLNPDEVVHHKNKIRNDNRIENLQLITFKEHAAFHAMERRNKERMMAY